MLSFIEVAMITVFLLSNRNSYWDTNLRLTFIKCVIKKTICIQWTCNLCLPLGSHYGWEKKEKFYITNANPARDKLRSSTYRTRTSLRPMQQNTCALQSENELISWVQGWALSLFLQSIKQRSPVSTNMLFCECFVSVLCCKHFIDQEFLMLTTLISILLMFHSIGWVLMCTAFFSLELYLNHSKRMQAQMFSWFWWVTLQMCS